MGYRLYDPRQQGFHVPPFLKKLIDPNYRQEIGQSLFAAKLPARYFFLDLRLANSSQSKFSTRHFSEMCVLSEDRCMLVFSRDQGEIDIVVRKIDRIKLFLAVIDTVKDIDLSYFE